MCWFIGQMRVYAKFTCSDSFMVGKINMTNIVANVTSNFFICDFFADFSVLG